MSIVCALSNEVPEVPVVSPLSGAVFERRLIEKYIKENGTDPINGEELKEDQLIELKVPTLVKPKPPTFTSIPAILKSLQDEWDSVMLNSFTVRKQLLVARQELSHSLYQHDAACRVIARLNNELAAAREALATLKPQHDLSNGQSNRSSSTSNENGNELSDPTFLKRLQDNAKQLQSMRKPRIRELMEGLQSVERLKEFKTDSVPGLHSANPPGILALDVCTLDDNLLLTGGNDKQAIVFARDRKEIVKTLKGHSKKVSSVIMHPNMKTAITGSSDASIRIWNIDNGESVLLEPHNGPITDISLHPINNYLLSASTDELWAFSDITTRQCLLKLGDKTHEHALTTAQFHPDGIILGCGTSDGWIRIWDLKDRQNVANFQQESDDQTTGKISALRFSENGYYLAAAVENTVKIWDLRKLVGFKTITFENDFIVNRISFDQSGYYMAVAGNDLRIYETKKWENLRTFTDHTASVTDVRFGQNANFIASTSLDRELKIYEI